MRSAVLLDVSLRGRPLSSHSFFAFCCLSGHDALASIHIWQVLEEASLAHSILPISIWSAIGA